MTRDIVDALVSCSQAAGAIDAEALPNAERIVTQAFANTFETSDQLRNASLRAIGGGATANSAQAEGNSRNAGISASTSSARKCRGPELVAA